MKAAAPPARSRTKEEAAGRRRPDPLPRDVHPELATLIDAPFDDDAWLFEIKWDGFRAIATVEADGTLRMTSRNGKDFLGRFPQLAKLGSCFKSRPLVVDGEIVAFDEHDNASFQGLQNGGTAALTYVVFDVLYAEGRDLRALPLEARKEILDRLVKPSAKLVRISRHVLGQGKALYASAAERGLEGVVAKRRDAPYAERRTRDWLKIKAQLEQECVIAGFTDPEGSREGFGSLLLGLYEDTPAGPRLEYCGNVGTGFDTRTLGALHASLRRLETPTSPLSPVPKGRRGAHWVKPKLVAQVRFTEWTRDGSMRHPTFLGLRDDKSPLECRRERPVLVAPAASSRSPRDAV